MECLYGDYWYSRPEAQEVEVDPEPAPSLYSLSTVCGLFAWCARSQDEQDLEERENLVQGDQQEGHKPCVFGPNVMKRPSFTIVAVEEVTVVLPAPVESTTVPLAVESTPESGLVVVKLPKASRPIIVKLATPASRVKPAPRPSIGHQALLLFAPLVPTTPFSPPSRTPTPPATAVEQLKAAITSAHLPAVPDKVAYRPTHARRPSVASSISSSSSSSHSRRSSISYVFDTPPQSPSSASHSPHNSSRRGSQHSVRGGHSSHGRGHGRRSSINYIFTSPPTSLSSMSAKSVSSPVPAVVEEPTVVEEYKVVEEVAEPQLIPIKSIAEEEEEEPSVEFEAAIEELLDLVVSPLPTPSLVDPVAPLAILPPPSAPVLDLSLAGPPSLPLPPTPTSPPATATRPPRPTLHARPASNPEIDTKVAFDEFIKAARANPPGHLITARAIFSRDPKYLQRRRSLPLPGTFIPTPLPQDYLRPESRRYREFALGTALTRPLLEKQLDPDLRRWKHDAERQRRPAAPRYHRTFFASRTFLRNEVTREMFERLGREAPVPVRRASEPRIVPCPYSASGYKMETPVEYANAIDLGALRRGGESDDDDEEEEEQVVGSGSDSDSDEEVNRACPRLDAYGFDSPAPSPSRSSRSRTSTASSFPLPPSRTAQGLPRTPEDPFEYDDILSTYSFSSDSDTSSGGETAATSVVDDTLVDEPDKSVFSDDEDVDSSPPPDDDGADSDDSDDLEAFITSFDLEVPFELPQLRLPLEEDEDEVVEPAVEKVAAGGGFEGGRKERPKSIMMTQWEGLLAQVDDEVQAVQQAQQEEEEVEQPRRERKERPKSVMMTEWESLLAEVEEEIEDVQEEEE